MAKAKNWAIVVGINAYEHIGQLRYANCDAAALRDFFREVKFDRVFCFADGLQLSPEPDQKSVQPRHSDLEDFLHDRFTTKTPPLSAGDNCWFFFAGHGKRIQNRDYLLPQDYNPRQQDPTRRAISVNFVREALLKSGADNVILLLDACRMEGDRADGLGIGDEQPGAITIFSCQPNQKAYEIEKLQQGAFTAALLEGLRMPKASDNCATVQRLDTYLRRRVRELCQSHPEKPDQTPTTAVDPGQKWYLPLLPDVATEADVERLRMEALKTAQFDKNPDLAEHLWIRVLAVAQGQDSDAIRALQAIAVQKAQSSSAQPSREQSAPPQTPPASPAPDHRSTDSQSSPPPVRPSYRREEVRPVTPISTHNVQPAQPANSHTHRSIPWIYLASFGSIYAVYAVCGMFLTSASAPFWVLAVAVAVAGAVGSAVAGTLAGALAGALAGILAGALAGSGVSFFAMAGALIGALAGAGGKLLTSFSRFHTFLILAGTPLAGLGLGWLVYWAFKATSAQ